MKLTKAARHKRSKKQDSKHRCRLECYVNSRFFYTFLEHIVLSVGVKNSLSAGSQLDGESLFLKTGLKLGIFKYIYL